MPALRKVIVLIVLGMICLLLIPYTIPFLLALLTAILLEPIVSFAIRVLSIKRIAAVALVFLLFFTIFGIGGYRLVSVLILQGMELAQKLPVFLSTLPDFIDKFTGKWERFATSLPFDAVSTAHQFTAPLKNFATNAAASVTKLALGGVASIPGLLIVSIIYLISLFLISMDLPRLRRNFMSLFTDSAREKVELVLTQLFRAFIGFLRAQVILSLVTYVLTLIGLLVLDVNYALLLSLIIVIVDLLPILGAGSFLIPWAIYSYANGETRLCLGLLILFAVITVVRRAIEPKVLGSSLGISALSALVSLYVGFQLFGFIGLILGPAFVIVYVSLRKAGFLKIKIDF